MTGRDDDACLATVLLRAQQIATLNDKLRRSAMGGRLYLTSGVASFSQNDLVQILRAVRDFDQFDGDNDPYGEHDFGAFDYAGQKLFWKIDYYDRDQRYASPDPTDPKVTLRVLTILLASEW